MEKVTFLVTNKCNFRCKHCFVNGGEIIKNELTDEEKYQAIDNLYNLGIKKLTFSGGEPLMNKNLFNYMNYAKNKGLKIGFLTNGMLLSDENIEKLKEITDTFSISLYTQDILGIDDKKYNNYLDKIIKVLIKLKEINFTLTMLISQTNKNEICNLMKMILKEKIKPKTLRIYMITPLGRAKDNIELCTDEINCADIFNKMTDEIKKLNISYEYTSVKDEEIKKSGCSTDCPIIKYENNYINKFADPHMDSNGDLYLCGLLLRNKRYCIGNIIKDNKERIFGNIKKVVGDIKINSRSGDCCPALNRKKKENEQLVCPVIYVKKL